MGTLEEKPITARLTVYSPVLNALELGFIYALVAMALFLSFRVLNIADMTTDGAFSTVATVNIG